jgi:MFS transporter, DHA2 family, multidrug resistance protein
MSDSGLLPADPDAWRPSVNPWIIAASVMLATFMEVLDTSVANVALPHIAGNLSASTDEATWVLTSYLVSNAIVLPMTGWLSSFFGRKRFLLSCIFLFTLASAACGSATSLGMLIFSRIVQGAAGGALQPMSQAILLESFPPAKRGVAMAVFGLGVVVAPIIGPVLGGWITDNYTWRWVFYVNIPVGLLAFIMSQAFLEDPPYLKAAHEKRGGKVDYIGFGMMALGLGVLQVILDRGQQDDWFNAAWICWGSAVMVVSLVFFVLWELQAAHPLVDLRVFRNRSFAVGTLLMTAVGVVLYSTTALLPLFLQTLMGYPAYNSGLTMSPRGMGAIASLFIVSRFVGKIDNRILITLGFCILAYGTFQFGGINLQVGAFNVTLPNVIMGFAMGFIFVPLTTATMGDLPNQQMGNATGIFNLMRNIGGSIGISMATTLVARGSQAHQALMVGHLSPYDPSYQQAIQSAAGALGTQGNAAVAGQQAQGLIYGTLVQQSALWAYVETFRVLALVCLFCIPVVMLLKKVRAKEGAMAMH